MQRKRDGEENMKKKREVDRRSGRKKRVREREVLRRCEKKKKNEIQKVQEKNRSRRVVVER